jgi:hypothetical protein
VSTADLLAQAIDTLWTLIQAGAAWLVLLALAGTAALYTITVTVVLAVRVMWRSGRWAVQAARRGPVGPSWARGALRARILARTRTRAPHGHTEPRGYREAA